MTIRSLAAGLGVAPMSLYRHIRDKDDLLDEVVDRLLAPAWRPSAAEDDWQAWVTEAASRLRDFLVSQPAALHVYLSHPVVSPAAIQRMNTMLGVLRRTGINEQPPGAPMAPCTPTPSASPRSKPPSAPGTGQQADAGSLARQLAAYTTTRQFMDGLRYLLEGIGGHARTDPESGK